MRKIYIYILLVFLITLINTNVFGMSQITIHNTVYIVLESHPAPNGKYWILYTHDNKKYACLRKIIGFKSGHNSNTKGWGCSDPHVRPHKKNKVGTLTVYKELAQLHEKLSNITKVLNNKIATKADNNTINQKADNNKTQANKNAQNITGLTNSVNQIRTAIDTINNSRFAEENTNIKNYIDSHLTDTVNKIKTSEEIQNLIDRKVAEKTAALQTQIQELQEQVKLLSAAFPR